MEKNTFDVIILNGRPAAGKSEVIDYLKKVPLAKRIERFHIGEFEELDDFPILWERFEDDDLMEEMGLPRLISDREFEYQGKKYPGCVFKGKWFWNFLIRKLNLAYAKLQRDQPAYHQGKTLFIEFSRGSEHGGFRTAYDHLSTQVLENAVTLYIRVDWPESLRKNRRRYNPDRPDSILQHALEDKKIEKLYKESDWDEFAADPQYLRLGERKIPYAVFENMPEKTDKPDVLGAHLHEVLDRLWNVWKEVRP
ncbi:MAG: hypothetical protein KJ808_05825 [Acidobacteria bacterium]|nr:hypothetical protein [Acidobacteriota bacterium]MBU4306977.1 hypothetical protein [Acidobacteriota bacterium]MBU4405631.1 hypothetical protein [Acidobacteriota bacterium]MCG2812160.1 hypothetical protein [Candidatus Aminicenantes bacterium]